MSVAYPTNEAVQDEHMHKGLHLFAIWEALSSGKMPDNQQLGGLFSAISEGSLSIAQDVKRNMSKDARDFFSHFSEVIDDSYSVLKKKNRGDLLQNAVYELTQSNASTNAPDIWNDTSQNLNDQGLNREDLKQFFLLFFNNSHLREILRDVLALFGRQGSKLTQQKFNQWDPQQGKLGQKSPSRHQNGPNESSRHQGYDGDYLSVFPAREQRENQSNEESSKTNQFFNDPQSQQVRKETSEELRKIMDQLKRLVVDLQQDNAYQHPLQSIFGLVEKFVNELGDKKGKLQVETNDHIDRALRYLRELAENAVNHSLQPLINVFKKFHHCAQEDRELKQWFQDCYAYMRKFVLKKGYAITQDATDEYNELYERGRKLMKGRHKHLWDELCSESKSIKDSAASDSCYHHLGDDGKRLYNILVEHKGGETSLKKNTIYEILQLSLPVILARIQYFPIPRLEIEQPAFDIVLENLNLQTINILPKIAEFRNNNLMRLSPYGNVSSIQDHLVHLHLAHIQTDLKNVNYYIRRKQGFPKFVDQGIVDLGIHKQGMVVDLALSATPKTPSRQLPGSFFRLDHVKVDVHNIKLKVRKSRHKALLNFLKPSMMTYIRTTVARSLEVSIRRTVEQLDRQCYEIHREAQNELDRQSKRPTEEQDSRTKVYGKTIYNRFSSMQQRSQSSGSNQKIRVALHEQNSELSNIVLPSHNLEEGERLRRSAHSGTAWRSPVYDSLGAMGSAGAVGSLANRSRPSKKSKRSSAKNRQPATARTMNEGQQPNANGSLNQTILSDQMALGNVTEIPLPPANTQRRSLTEHSIGSFGDEQRSPEVLFRHTDAPKRNHDAFKHQTAVT
ncbi:uncharacterized protein SOCG_04230 [Schizosaccharomyces octosporus yFS286]|uniref:Fungal protein n=1 Tax=Schizosaccharomyces octosporus (strain yFS286) TaxID=483514 RepID=S9PRW1_SCHOY|nr:uncharacterized protein SOCG_04230 [Schizosaccharomyces octosporus yFS286]EPX70727.1 fungal protein [Schizosaccharomyces octosporus yFS286]